MKEGKIRVTADRHTEETARERELEAPLDVLFCARVASQVPARSGGDQYMRANLVEPELLRQLKCLLHGPGIELIREQLVAPARPPGPSARPGR
jgi:hypothetical protein